jgi:hypothetical protein
MLITEVNKWSRVWHEAHDLAEAAMPRLESGVCKQPGLAALLANFAVRAIEQERERCARLATNGCLAPPDGGSPTEDEARLCDAIAAAIRNPLNT